MSHKNKISSSPRRRGDAEKPKRIQLSRKKGFKLPANTVVVARPGRCGNPFKVHAIDPKDSPQTILMDAQNGICYTRDAAVHRYRRWLDVRTSFQFDIIRELRGKNLACWCPLDQPCHADVMLKIANSPPPRLRVSAVKNISIKK